jgi:hypothetical protein
MLLATSLGPATRDVIARRSKLRLYDILCASQRFLGLLLTAGLPQISQLAATAKILGSVSSF